MARRRIPDAFRPGIQSEEHRHAFLEGGRPTRIGAPGKPLCGARLPGGKLCAQPVQKGEARCFRHAGPAAARRRREAQLRGLAAGTVSPAEFARAEARRARNALQDRWKRDPRLPGATIDLGPDEGTFRAEAERRGVDVDALYPATADWLRWQWQRRQKDRQDHSAWMRLCREELPRRIARAHAAALWASLGGYSRSTPHGTALAATLAREGPEAAQTLRDEWRVQGVLPPPPRRSLPLTFLPVRPWTSGAPQPGSKRQHKDPVAAPPIRTPAPLPDEDMSPEAVGALLRQVDAGTRKVFAELVSPAEQQRFIAALRAVVDRPGEPQAGEAWRTLVPERSGPGQK